ncbi:nitroreductase [Micromonospora sp. R77]|uniref:nitroreductase n=1 Tax=Micromonospora sp. R77 TaxID=2925836 RepID=UPI001F60711D|nr:nitroreductase [Micromonospora sp. R77]MCI4065131.1 nitroreductase [Micromonospora sp. R77]
MDISALHVLAPLFWRAPSAHNTQPWRLDYRDEEVHVGWDHADTLPAADPTGRDLRLSLGAFVETCLIVAADLGLPIEYVPDHCVEDRRVGWLRLSPHGYRSPFTAAQVQGRRTHRGRFSAGPDADTVAALDAVARQAGGEVRVVPDRDRLAGLLTTADRHLYAEPAVVRELRGWLRLTPAHPRYPADGLTDRCLELSPVEATGLRAALAAYPVLRPLGLPRLLAAAAGDPLALGGTVIVLVGPAGLDDAAQVEFGRVLMRTWLTLHAAGLAAHPLSQLIDAPATRAALGSALDGRRSGCCTSPGWAGRSARRPARRAGSAAPAMPARDQHGAAADPAGPIEVDRFRTVELPTAPSLLSDALHRTVISSRPPAGIAHPTEGGSTPGGCSTVEGEWGSMCR